MFDSNSSEGTPVFHLKDIKKFSKKEKEADTEFK